MATSAQINQPRGSIAFDSAGSAYIADMGNNRIRKVWTNGLIGAWAGTGSGGYSGDGGAAASAQINQPIALATDASDNLYVADMNNNRIRMITPGGFISTYAGTGGAGFSGDNGARTAAQINNPRAIAIDRTNGLMYIADGNNQRIRRINMATGIITTVAGTGGGGYSGDGCLGTSAQLNQPNGLALDSAGNLFIADSQNNRIRRLDYATGIITTVAGSQSGGFSGDGGMATAAQLSFPRGVAVDPAGNLYIADTFNHRIRKVDAGSGKISTISGLNSALAGDGGAASSGRMAEPSGLAFDAAGALYISDANNHRIRKILSCATPTSTPSPTSTVTPGVISSACSITTVAGTGCCYNGDGMPALSSQLDQPKSAYVDAGGNLFISHHGGHRIRKVDPGQIISTYAGANAGFSGDGGYAACAQLNQPVGVIGDAAGNLYIADSQNHRIRKVTPAGIISTFAGTGTAGYSGNGGAATSANINNPHGLAIDPSGTYLYFADTGNNRVRRIDLSTGIITLMAGNGTAGFAGDGAAATSAQLNQPTYVAVDGSYLYISDTNNHRIRRVTLGTGNIATFAGTGTPSFSGDGGAATSAQLNNPRGIVIEAATGNVFFADSANHRIRQITPAGIISTISGAASGYAGDGGAASTAQFNEPWGLNFDSRGRLYISDRYNHRVRRISACVVLGTPTPTFTPTPSHTASPALSPTPSFSASPTFTVTPTPIPTGTGLCAQYYDDTNSNHLFDEAVACSVVEGPINYGGGAPANCGAVGADWFVVRWSGQVLARYSETYTFYTSTDDGARLWVNGTQLVNRWIDQAETEVSGTIALTAGVKYDIIFEYYQGAGGAAARLRWSSPSQAKEIIPAAYLYATSCGGTPTPSSTISRTPTPMACSTPDCSGSWTVIGNGSMIGSGYIRLTGDLMDQSTAMWSNFMLDLNQSWNADYDLYFGTKDATGADGIVFVMQNDPRGLAAIGDPGRGISYAQGISVSPVNISPSVAVEFDTWQNTELGPPAYSDPAYDHTSIHLNGIGSETSALGLTPTSFASDNIEDGQWHRVRISWNRTTNTLQVYFDSVLRVSYSSDIVASVFGGQTCVYWGFTSGTGGSSNVQEVKEAECYSPTPTYTPTPTHSPTRTATPTQTPQGTATPTYTITRTFSISPSPTRTPSNTPPPSPTPSRTHSPVLSPTPTFTPGAACCLLNSMTINNFAGNGAAGTSPYGNGGAATSGNLDQPHGVGIDSSGNVYIGDTNHAVVRKVDAGGTISTYAGTNASPGFTGDGGAATSALLDAPRAVRMDSSGNLFIVDLNNHRIRKVDSGGTISLVAGTNAGFSGDNGAATSAQLNQPRGIAVAGSYVYIADSQNHRIRRVDTGTGIITTIAGNGTVGSAGDGGAATSANLSQPSGLAISGNTLYIADTGNNKIRAVDLGSGIISTVAGTGTQGNIGDGGAATSAQLNQPWAVAVDTCGSLIIADTGNHRIRKVSSGTITLLAGNSAGSAGDGGPASAATFNQPRDLVVNPVNGDLYIADTLNLRVRRISCVSPPTPTPTVTATPTSICSSAHPSIAGSSGATTGNSSSLTYNVSGGSGSNRLLVVRAFMDTTTANVITGITYAGVALSRLYSVGINSSQGVNRDFETWYLVAPATGFNNIIASWGGVGLTYNISYVFYQNVDQSNPLGAYATNALVANATSYTSNLTTTNTNSLISDTLIAGAWNGAAVASMGPGQTSEYTRSVGGPTDIWGTNKTTINPGAYSLTYTMSSNTNCCWSSQTLEINALSCFSPTPTPPPSGTPTRTPAMPLVKSTSLSQASIGDTITFCMQWTNDSSATRTMNIWDTKSSYLTYVGCNNSCSVSGSLVSWSFSAASGATGSVCFWGTVNGYP